MQQLKTRSSRLTTVAVAAAVALAPAATALAQTGGGYALTGGFWPALCPSRLTSSAIEGHVCDSADFDGDLDVDQSESGLFQCRYSGEDMPANPICG